MTAHSHVRLQFRCLGNRSALTLKPHLKHTYLFRARSFIAKHGVLLVFRCQGEGPGPPGRLLGCAPDQNTQKGHMNKNM